MPNPVPRLAALVILVFIFVPVILSADTVYLRDGRVLTGSLQTQNPTSIVFKLESGQVLTIAKVQIRRIVHGPSESEKETAKKREEEEKQRAELEQQEEEKRKEQEKADRLKKEEEEKKREENHKREIALEREKLQRQALLRAVVPGIGHFYLNENQGGAFFLTSTLTLATFSWGEWLKEAPFRRERDGSFARILTADSTGIFPLAAFYLNQARSSEERLRRARNGQEMAQGLFMGVYLWSVMDIYYYQDRPATELSRRRLVSFLVPGISQLNSRRTFGTGLLASFFTSGTAALLARQENDAWRSYYGRTIRDSTALLAMSSDRSTRDVLLMANVQDLMAQRKFARRSTDRFNAALAIFSATYVVNAVDLLLPGEARATLSGAGLSNSGMEAGLAVHIPF